MNEFLTWRAEWAHGIPWVDRDHQAMVECLNRLEEVCECLPGQPGRIDPRCRDQVLERLDALIEHNRRHFQAEEAFLRQIAFPGLEDHCREHSLQLAEFRQLRRDLAADLPGHFGPETLSDFKRWFFNHVVAEDRAYADYYHAHAGDAPAGAD